MTKPESETDPWAKVKRRQGTVIEHGPGVLGGGAWSAKAAVYLAKEVDAARAAEAAQHRQEIAAKDATIKRIQNAARVLVDGADRRGEAEVKRRVAAGLPTLDSEREMNAILTDENDALRVRLAAVEAERDHARKCEANHMMADHERIEALKAERDRLKAALQDVTIGMDRAGGDRDGMPECPWCQSQGRPEDAEEGYAHDVDCSLMMARAALTTQGQSTDGETR